MIGKVHGAGPVGVYAMAFQFARLPFMIVTGPLQYVLYPHVATIREDRAQMRALFLLLTRLLATVLLPAVGLVAVASEPTFNLLLSPKWGQAAHIFEIIAPATALQPVTAIVGTFLMALGRTDVQMRLAWQFATFWLVGLMASVAHGIEAVAAAYTICGLLFSMWSLRICLPLVNCSFNVYARILLLPTALTALSILVYSIIKAPSAGHEFANVCLAAFLSLITISFAMIAQRRDLSDAWSLTTQARADVA